MKYHFKILGKYYFKGSLFFQYMGSFPYWHEDEKECQTFGKTHVLYTIYIMMLVTSWHTFHVSVCSNNRPNQSTAMQARQQQQQQQKKNQRVQKETKALVECMWTKAESWEKRAGLSPRLYFGRPAKPGMRCFDVCNSNYSMNQIGILI